MSPHTGRWTLGLGLAVLGLLVLAALAGSAIAAPLAGFAPGSALADLDVARAPVFEAVLLGAVGLLAIALLEQAERWR